MNIFSLLFQSVNKEIIPPRTGLSNISKISAGKFGTLCKGSLPLPNFPMKDPGLKEAISKGKSTFPDNRAGRFLKASLDTPLSTSEVHNCSVVYVYNTQTETHCLLHIHPSKDLELFEERIKNLMGEGFDGGAIILGENWLLYHQKTLPYQFSILKKINADSIINVYHCMSVLPEIVCYKGNCFQITNVNRKEKGYFRGQASFNIIDLFISNIPHIANGYTNLENLEAYRKDCIGKYTPEIMEILKSPFSEREALIKHIYAEDYKYTLEDCGKADYNVSNIMYAKLEQQWLKEAELIVTRKQLLAFLSKLREQIIPASYGFPRNYIMKNYMKTLNEKLHWMVKKFNIENCKETDILFDQRTFDKLMKEIKANMNRGSF